MRKLSFFAILVCQLYLHGQRVSGRALEQDVYDDTIVDIGTEPSKIHSIYKRSPLVEEIMGPLSRNVRQVMTETERSQMVYEKMRILLTILRYHLRGSPNIEIFQFVNWDKTIIIDQLFYVKPKTIWEVRRVIMAARTLGLRVRATGNGHSRSPLYVDEGNIMMDVRDLQRHDGPMLQLNQPTAERNFKTVTATTGIFVLELNSFMTQNRVTLMGEALNDQETVGGVVSAGTHGSTYTAETYSGVVVEMRIMDSRGRLRKFTKEKHPGIMRALCMHLGMFGILYDATIRVEPTVVVKLENHFLKIRDVFFNKTALKDLVTTNLNCEISYFPFNNLTPEQIQNYEATKRIPDNWEAGDDIVWIRTGNIISESEAQGKTILGPTYIPGDGSLSSGTRPGLLRASASLEGARRLEPATYHYLADAFPIIFPPLHGTETSAAFLLNVDNDFDRPYRAIRWLVERVERQIKENGTTPLNALLPRFFKNSDDCDLCFANNGITMPNDAGNSFVIDFLAPPAQDGFYQAAEDFVAQFQNEKLRPHWSKRHDNIHGIMPIIKSTFGNLLTDFVEQKRRARVDPCDMFMNSYLIAIFGTSPECY